jgi:hypothetical protein
MAHKSKISKVEAGAIAAAMKNAKKGLERKAVVDRFMAELGASERAIYRAAKRGGWTSGNRARKDRGKCKMKPDEIQSLVALQANSKRKDRHTIMPMEVALDVAASSGMVSSRLSVSRLNQITRNNRMSRRQMEYDIDHGPHINMISLHPNHVHQVDVTNCVQYFLRKSNGAPGAGGNESGTGKLGHRDMMLEFSIKKPDAFKKIKKRLMRYVLIDHYSGAFFVRYYYASGERGIDMAEFLIEAWGARTPAREACVTKYPFRGVPEILVCDKGSALMNSMVLGLLGPLGVEVFDHMPGNPRAKGAVEGFMWIWEQHFESRLSAQPAPDLETLNDWALDYCVNHNAKKKHTRHGSTRSKKWLEIPANKFRILPPDDVCKELLNTRPEKRMVRSNLCISYRGSEFRVSNPDLEGRKVTVSINPYRWLSDRRSVDVTWKDQFGDEKKLEAFEVLRDPASGFRVGEKTAIFGKTFARQKNTATQNQIKDLPDVKEEKIKAFGHHAAKVSPLAHIQPRGNTVDIETERPAIPEAQALLILKDKLKRPLLSHETEVIEAMANITRDDVDKLAADFLEMEAQQASLEDTTDSGA